MEEIKLEVHKELYKSLSTRSSKYFGILKDLVLIDDSKIIDSLSNSEIYVKLDYYDLRNERSPNFPDFEIRRFHNGYAMKPNVFEELFIHFYYDGVFMETLNHLLKIENITKFNLNHLINEEQKIKRLQDKINQIFDSYDQTFLDSLTSYSNAYSQTEYKITDRFDHIIKLNKKYRDTEDNFSNWERVFFKYFKGLFIGRDEIPELDKWRTIAKLDIELRYYNEIIKNFNSLSKVDYFNSISQLTDYQKLKGNDILFYSKLQKVVKESSDLEIIFRILLNSKEKNNSFFVNLFRYLYDEKHSLNKFNFIGNTTFENIINSCYSDLQPFKIGTNALGRKWKNYFKSFEK